MAIYIAGGSNSVYHNGWVGRLRRHIDDEIINLSIGLNATLMALFRVMTSDIRAGDTLIWEYALNDRNHIQLGYPKDYLLRYLEYLIRYCADQDIKFIALIFKPKNEILTGDNEDYYADLMAMLTYYDVVRFDMTRAVMRRKGEDPVALNMFSDENHYTRNEDTMRIIMRGLKLRLPKVKVPHKNALPLLLSGDEIIEINQDGLKGRFENSLLSLPACAVPAAQLPSQGRLVSVIVTKARGAGRLQLSQGDQSVDLSAEPHESVGEKTVLRAVSLAQDCHAPNWQADGPLHIAQLAAEDGSDPTCDIQFLGAIYEST